MPDLSPDWHLANGARKAITLKVAQKDARPSDPQRASHHYQDSIPCHHGVVQPVMGQPRVALYAGVVERAVFVDDILLEPSRVRPVDNRLGIDARPGFRPRHKDFFDALTHRTCPRHFFPSAAKVSKSL